MPFDLTDGVSQERDDQGVARSLEHIQQPYVAEAATFDAPTPRRSPRAT